MRYLETALRQGIRQHHARTTRMGDNGKALSRQWG